MRVLLTLAAAVILCATAFAEEETPRPDRAKAPAATTDAAPRLQDGPADWKEISEAVKQFAGSATVLLAVILFGALGWGFLGFVVAISPNLTERVGKALHASRLKCFLIGTCAFLFSASLVHVSHRRLGVIIGPLLLVALAWGLCGVCEDVGRRAFMLSSRDPGRFAKMSLGWPVFYLASLFPVVGWFLVFPVLSLSGLGAFCIALMSRAAPAAKVMPR